MRVSASPVGRMLGKTGLMERLVAEISIALRVHRSRPSNTRITRFADVDQPGTQTAHRHRVCGGQGGAARLGSAYCFDAGIAGRTSSHRLPPCWPVLRRSIWCWSRATSARTETPQSRNVSRTRRGNALIRHLESGSMAPSARWPVDTPLDSGPPGLIWLTPKPWIADFILTRCRFVSLFDQTLCDGRLVTVETTPEPARAKMRSGACIVR